MGVADSEICMKDDHDPSLNEMKAIDSLLLVHHYPNTSRVNIFLFFSYTFLGFTN